RGGVYGLTTAATIWLVASIGVACGAHLYALAALATFIALIVLLGLAQLEKPLQRYGKKHKRQSPDDRQRQADEG
ncbi:MAG: MgtC/SapB family protein, partial [Planctomycetota bacterium]